MISVLPIVMPVFGTVALGYGLARWGLFSQTVGAGLERFMYYLAIPAMLITGVASAELPAQVPWTYLLAFYLPSFTIYATAMAIFRHNRQWPRQAAAMGGMAASYSNMFLLGLPLCLSAFGAAGQVPLYILLATQSTLLFPVTTLTLEMNATGASRLGSLLRLLRHPVLLGLAAGIALNLSGLSIPDTPGRILALLAAAGPGCALVALGITLAGHTVRGALRDVLILAMCKNCVHPVLVWLACIAFEVEADWMRVAVVLAAMPTGINALIFARQYAIREDVVSQGIVVTTLISSVVVTVLLGLIV